MIGERRNEMEAGLFEATTYTRIHFEVVTKRRYADKEALPLRYRPTVTVYTCSSTSITMLLRQSTMLYPFRERFRRALQEINRGYANGFWSNHKGVDI